MTSRQEPGTLYEETALTLYLHAGKPAKLQPGDVVLIDTDKGTVEFRRGAATMQFVEPGGEKLDTIPLPANARDPRARAGFIASLNATARDMTLRKQERQPGEDPNIECYQWE